MSLKPSQTIDKMTEENVLVEDCSKTVVTGKTQVDNVDKNTKCDAVATRQHLTNSKFFFIYNLLRYFFYHLGNRYS